MSNVKKQPIVPTPIGTAIYPHLLKPDAKWDADNPKYTTKLRFDVNDPEYIAFKKAQTAALDAMIEQFKIDNPKFAKRVSIKHELFRAVFTEEGEETNEEELKATRKYIMRDKTTGKESRVKLDILDSKKRKVQLDALWGGSKIRLAVRLGMSSTGAEITPFFHIYAVQVIDLVSGGGGGDVFGAVEDGFVGDEDSAQDAGGADSYEAQEGAIGAANASTGDEEF